MSDDTSRYEGNEWDEGGLTKAYDCSRSSHRLVMKTKTQTAWAILAGKILLPFSIRSTRKQAISDHVRNHYCKDWKDAKRRGNSVQKVTIEYSS